MIVIAVGFGIWIFANRSCKETNTNIDKNIVTNLEQKDDTVRNQGLFKPVIYLYPEKETDVTVNLNLDGKLTCTYPKSDGEWTVTAKPDGTLVDKKGIEYNYLYWEGQADVKPDFSKGYCVKGEDSATFLEEKLKELGLNRREVNEFITYWLPQMEQNKYNIISFQTDNYTNSAKLKVNPSPDTIIRVFMAFKASNHFVNMESQTIETPQRNGFTVVEWGGTKLE